MGVIKKLKGKELVGWQLNPEVDVYPITHIGAVFNDLNVPLSDILNGLQEQISGGSGGGSSASTYPINYLWAYTTARTDSEALSKINRSELVDVPTNFVGNTSFTVPDGYYIYMTTARNQGGVYLRWEDNSIWSVPVRIGSGYTTSYTGNDGEGYNYAYCRTDNDTPPNIPASLTVVRLEGLSDNQGISASNGSISLASYNVWYDHPLGVDGTYQWEWVAISRGSDSAGWSAYTGPTLWSKFGVDGRDGDGIEYIFTAVAEDAPTPLFINKYNGRIGEQSSDYQEVPIVNCTSNSFYQQDDFIPSGWHDTPQTLSLSYNKQYVSVRKKRFTSENEGYWGPFSLPVLWAKISSSAITMTLDNDAVILDDNTSSTSTKIVSCTGIHIWDGNREITTDPNYYIEITASPINSIDDILVLNVVSQIEGNLVHTTDIQDPDYSSGYGYNFTYSVDTFQSSLGMMFCLSRLNELAAMNEGAYAIGYTARVYNRGDDRVIAEIAKSQSVLIVNINDGVSYSMQVTPNSLPVSRPNSNLPYTFTGINQIDITVKACSGTEVTSCNIYNSNQGEGKLYVTVRAYNAQGPTSVEYASYSSGNGSDIISYTLSDAGNNCLYYIVNLYYVSEGISYLVETETVDLVIKGDDGASAYTLSMSNDSAIIDELTVDADSLAVTTANLMTVYEGVVDITSRCTFSVTSSSLPTGLSVSNNGRDFKLVPNSDIREILDEGNYSYTVTAYIDDVPVAVKMFKFIVRNITADGTVFKLNITNDTWQYDGDTGASITTQRSSVSVSSITSGTSLLESFTMISSSASIPSTGLVVVYPVTLSSLVDTSSKLITPYGEFTVNGWDLQLYYNAVLVDSEHIDCVRNGRNGKDGTGAYTLTIDNDSAVLDDNTTNADSIRMVTTVTASLFYGDLNYTTNNNTKFYLGFSSIPALLVIKNNNGVTISSSGTELPNGTLYLAPNGTIASIDMGNFKVQIYAEYNGTSVATKTFTFSVTDLNPDGVVYKLNIENDSWTYTGDGARLGNVTSTLSVLGIVNGEPTTKTFTMLSETASVAQSGYIVTYPSILESYVNTTDKTVTPHATYNSNGFDFKLYYNGIKVDTEHIDCIKNGKDGEGVYFITLDNDTATLDDDTIDASAIRVATTVLPSFFVGTSNKTGDSATKFYIESLELPSQLILKNYAGVTKTTGDELYLGTFYLALANNAVTKLTQGQYSVAIYVTYNSVRVASKKFTFSITDLSPDGSFYTLTIENDTWFYDGDTGDVISSSNSPVTVNKITRGTINPQSFNFTTSLTYSGLEVLIPSGLTTSGTSILRASYYNVSGYNIRLYYNGLLCDSEHIDCVKNGATGADGADGADGAATQGLRGAVVRNRGEWKSGNITYCYNTDMEGNGPSENNIVYIDIVYYNGNYYQCVEHHTSTSSRAPGYTLYWTEALNFEFIATKVLAAEGADIKVLSSGSVAVFDDGISEGVNARAPIIVGGMTGGSTRSTNDVIIWAGGSDPNLSAFKVYEDGSFNFANNLFIWEKEDTLGTVLKYMKSSGNTTLSSLWVNSISPSMATSYTLLYYSPTITNRIESSITAGRALFKVTADGNRHILLYAGTASQGILQVELKDGSNLGTFTPTQVEVNDGSNWGRLTTTGATHSSDIRLKENFVDFLLTLEQMANSPLFKFNFKGHQDLLQVGTSALYWEPIIPEAISKKYDDRDKNEYLGLNYANVAFAAAISLAKEVKLLKEEVERLKSLLQLY